MTLALIAAEIITKHGITVDELKGRSRKALYARAREEFTALGRFNGYKFEAIGSFMNRHYSTTINQFTKFRRRYGLA